MLQLIGGGIMICVSLYIGAQFARGERRRVKQLEGFLFLLRHIKQGIVSFCDPLCDIYGRFKNPALEECGFLPVLRVEGFSRALQLCGARLYLSGEERDTLFAFASAVGKSYAGDQALLCDYTIKEMERAFARRKEEAPKRIQSISALAVCLGLMLLLLLY